MDWWTQAKFAVFINLGKNLTTTTAVATFANTGDGAIPPEEYRQLGAYSSSVGVARQWARLARRSGQQYMVLTTKNHDGYCLFDTKTTDFCATKQACGRDLVAEYVEAAR